jgi:hypothetical protein
MAQSCKKCVVIISLVLISAAELHDGRANGLPTEDINNPINISVKYAENIRDNIQKRMLLRNDDLSKVHQQLLLHYVSVDKVDNLREREHLQRELSKMKRVLQYCVFQVNRMQSGNNIELPCGQLSIM